ncbi:MAG: hypothetical protein ABEN55_24085 [Bradymonadaceae bacterium]
MASESKETNYYKAAATDQYNLIIMIFFALAALVSLNPAPLLIGTGLEMLYLLFVPETKFFQRYIDNKKFNRRAEQAEQERQQRVQSLPHSQRRRYRKIDSLIERTKENLQESSEGLGDRMIDKLNRLRERYLWMMELVNDYAGYLNSLQRGEIKNDISEVKKKLEESDGEVQSALKERLNILQKRFDRLEKVREHHQIVKTQVQTVEDILRLIYESSMTMQNPQGISKQIDDQVGNEEKQLAEFDEKLEKAKKKEKKQAVAQ